MNAFQKFWLPLKRTHSGYDEETARRAWQAACEAAAKIVFPRHADAIGSDPHAEYKLRRDLARELRSLSGSAQTQRRTTDG